MAVPPGLHAMFAVRGDLAKRPGEARNLGSIVAEIAMVAVEEPGNRMTIRQAAGLRGDGGREQARGEPAVESA